MAAHKAKYSILSAQPWRVRACAPTQPVASFPCASFPFCLGDSRPFAFIRGQKVWGPLCSSVSSVVKVVAVGSAEVIP